MKHRGRVRENTAIQAVAALVPALSALPSAFFVARSAWYWLILGWHLEFWPGLGALVAVVVGLVVEGLGTVSIFLALTFWRWNGVKAKRQGYDEAPLKLALLSVAVYVLATVVLLALLEAMGDRLAPYAPMVFPFLTIVGGLCWAMYDQHRDRLAEKGLSWNWVAERAETPARIVPERPKLDGTQRAVLDALRDDPGLSLLEVGRAAGVSKSTAHRRRLELEAMGLLPSRRNGHGG